jgi:hypothetical protein
MFLVPLRLPKKHRYELTGIQFRNTSVGGTAEKELFELYLRRPAHLRREPTGTASVIHEWL